MTALQWPTRRVVLSLPGLRLAVLVAFAGPLVVVHAGKESDTALRLLLVGLATAVAIALVWDDRCAPVTAATPVGLPAVRRGRGLALSAALVAGWAGSAWAADRAVPELPVTAMGIPVLTLAVVLLAVIGLLTRGRDGEPVGTYPVPVLLVLLLLLSRLPDSWALLVAPTDAAWPAARTRWLLLLVASAALMIWTLRDPASRPASATVRSCVRRSR